MGYFDNGTEGEIFEVQYCERCVHYDPDPEEPSCPVWMAHPMYNYSQHDNEAAEALLSLLIPRIGIRNECAMFISRAE